MTDFKDEDKTSKVGDQNFKDRILKELEEANRKRLLQEEAERQRRAAEAEAEHLQKEQELERQASEALKKQEEERESLAAMQSEFTNNQSTSFALDNHKHSTETVSQSASIFHSETLSPTSPEPGSQSLNGTVDSDLANTATSEVRDWTSEIDDDSAESREEELVSAAPHLAASRYSTITKSESEVSDFSGESAVPPSEQTVASLEAQNEAVVAQIEASKTVTEEVRTPMTRRKKNYKIAAKITGILVTIIVIVGLLTAFLGYRYVSSSLGAVDAKSKQFVTVEIPEGSGNKLVGQILEQNGLIKNASIFNYYARFKNVSDLQSGYYNLQKSMTVEEIIKALQQGGTAEPQQPVLGKILVTEGYTIDQIAKAITDNVNTKDTGDKTPFKSDDFLALMTNQTFINEMVQKYPKLLADIPSADEAKYQLEGYLFPATYNYYEGSHLEDVVDQMLLTMDTTLAPYYDQISSSGRTVNEVLSLASLVEKEGSTDEDRRNIASVFYNRLTIQMPLQSNIAVLYAMGKLGQETTLREDAAIDTKIDSPYNIYEHPGLMPGPVDSPGLSAIEATVNPADTDYLYFVADVTTGNVYYAEDFATHEANVAKYVNAHLESSGSSNE
ncbi:endolytic transglycosylase MltG [Streptococcus pluranimalium]